MRDLRRQALESNKTVSRKARGKIAAGSKSLAVPDDGSAAGSKSTSAAGSKNPSAAASRTTSRNASRQASDDEDAMSDTTAWSANSIDELLAFEDSASLWGDDLAGEGIGPPPAKWRDELETRIEQIIDRKRSSVQGREETLAGYLYYITTQYTEDILHSRMSEIIPGLMKSVKAESSERETALALRALSTTIITDPSDNFYGSLQQQLRRIIDASESLPTKAAAIRTLSVATFFGGAGNEDMMEVMEYLLSIVESDGAVIEAEDDAQCVIAALEEWGFLITKLDDLDDLEVINEPAMDAFVEQLDSADPAVAIAAGENIAMLYEKSHTELGDDEEPPSDEERTSSDDGEIRDPNAPTYVQRYTVYRRTDQLLEKLSSLARTSARSISKKDRKCLHGNFSDIVHSVENPTRGPRYSTALDGEGRRYGTRMTVRIHRTGEMPIDRWWKLLRLQGLRRVLGAGFVRHYEENDVVGGTLPAMMRVVQHWKGSARKRGTVRGGRDEDDEYEID
ncbi:hypothetical protein K402DRAFT_353856 [Aulographum hederae CBS 113979]|uniref:Interferon-related developmental regulator N-terminal domain-containing protein n=1 Tax=Aulographum hederae CBS 113979 TaxID=1176131 RepID=A0A6G1H2X4_9PEZI|nr:hypothetical protein K402DRAFT_353856 [Aulographum hederae CBS 113979]